MTTQHATPSPTTLLRKRVTIDCSEPQITDQSFKSQCDINVIMAQYAKTGMLPNQITIPPEFRDNTNTPSLEDAHNIVKGALNAFNSLPLDLRKLMDHNPQNLENFIADPNNGDFLRKHGILNKITQQTTITTKQEGSTLPTAKTET